jgi:hypothetical protein
MVVHTCNASTKEAEVGGHKFKVSQGYRARPCLKNNNSNFLQVQPWALWVTPHTQRFSSSSLPMSQNPRLHPMATTVFSTYSPFMLALPPSPSPSPS